MAAICDKYGIAELKVFGSARSRLWLAVLASPAELQADAPAPSWLVRVRTCLALHFPGANLRLCLDRRGLLIWEYGRHLFAILPGPAAKQTHNVAKKTHGVIIGRRLADVPHLGLGRRSAGRFTCVSCLPKAIGTGGSTASTAMTGRPTAIAPAASLLSATPLTYSAAAWLVDVIV